SKDRWYMGVTLQYGPDGGVFASDWSDTGECHSRTNTRRNTGRIYKITFGKPPADAVDLSRLDDLALVKLQQHRNDWYVRHARRLLQEHAAEGRDLSEARRELYTMFRGQGDVPRQLRALWALKVIGGLDDGFLVDQLSHESEFVRSWCIRLLCEGGAPPANSLRRFRELALHGDSPLERLYLAGSLQRLGPQQRW